MSGAQPSSKEIELDGIKYKLGRYRYGQKLEMNEKVIELEVLEINEKDPKKSRIKPRVRKDLLELLSVLHALKKWTFKGYDDEDNLILDESKPDLPITEANVRELPPHHGEELLKASGEINGLDPVLRKNL